MSRGVAGAVVDRVESGLRRSPTAADVAKVAGVSVATVSLVVNNKTLGRVAPLTEVRVREAVDLLGYSVDEMGRGLSTGRRDTVALVGHDLTNPFYAAVVAGAAAALGSQQQLILVTAPYGRGLLLSSIERVLALRPGGIIIGSPRTKLIHGLRPNCPVVVMDAPGVESNYARVDFDIQGGTDALGQYLYGLGHRRIGYMDAADDSPTFHLRRSVLARKFQARGRESVFVATESAIDVTEAQRSFMAQWAAWAQLGVTVVVCAVEVIAYGVLGAARELGLAVPGDISVASYDDLPYATVVSPPLTSVALSAYDLGFESASLLMDVRNADRGAATRVVLPAVLRIRASTALPRGSRAGHALLGERPDVQSWGQRSEWSGQRSAGADQVAEVETSR